MLGPVDYRTKKVQYSDLDLIIWKKPSEHKIKYGRDDKGCKMDVYSVDQIEKSRMVDVNIDREKCSGRRGRHIDQKMYLAKIKIVLKQLTVNIKSMMYYSVILFKNYNYAVSCSTD